MSAAQMRLEQARTAINSEADQATGLQNRAAVIAAGSGVVLGIGVTVGRTLFQRDLPATVFEVVFLCTLAALLVAAAFAGYVLVPRSRAGPQIQDIEDLASTTLQPSDEENQASALIESLVDELAETRLDNNRNIGHLRRALVCLAVGVVGTAVLGSTLAFSEPENAAMPRDHPTMKQQPRPSGLERHSRGDRRE